MLTTRPRFRDTACHWLKVREAKAAGHVVVFSLPERPVLGEEEWSCGLQACQSVRDDAKEAGGRLLSQASPRSPPVKLAEELKSVDIRAPPSWRVLKLLGEKFPERLLWLIRSHPQPYG